MHVQVKVYATLRRYVEGAGAGTRLDVDLPEGAAVAELIARLGVPAEEVRMVFVNGRARPEDWHLEAGDEVGIFPPVGGG